MLAVVSHGAVSGGLTVTVWRGRYYCQPRTTIVGHHHQSSGWRVELEGGSSLFSSSHQLTPPAPAPAQLCWEEWLTFPPGSRGSTPPPSLAKSSWRLHSLALPALPPLSLWHWTSWVVGCTFTFTFRFFLFSNFILKLSFYQQSSHPSCSLQYYQWWKVKPRWQVTNLQSSYNKIFPSSSFFISNKGVGWGTEKSIEFHCRASLDWTSPTYLDRAWPAGVHSYRNINDFQNPIRHRCITSKAWYFHFHYYSFV